MSGSAEEGGGARGGRDDAPAVPGQSVRYLTRAAKRKLALQKATSGGTTSSGDEEMECLRNDEEGFEGYDEAAAAAAFDFDLDSAEENMFKRKQEQLEQPPKQAGSRRGGLGGRGLKGASAAATTSDGEDVGVRSKAGCGWSDQRSKLNKGRKAVDGLQAGGCQAGNGKAVKRTKKEAFKAKGKGQKRPVKERPSLSLVDLNEDALELIVVHLDTASALRLFVSCKTIHNRLAASSGFWYQLCLKENFNEYHALKQNDDEDEDEENQGGGNESYSQQQLKATDTSADLQEVYTYVGNLFLA